MSQEKAYKRRQYLVDSRFQLRFVTQLFMAVLGIAAVSTLFSSALLWKYLAAPNQGLNTPLVTSLIAIATTLLIELLLAIPIIFYLGIRQSHRIVGPMNRIKQMLQAIGTGDFSQRITLRHGDALEDLARSLNQMAESLQQRFPRPPGS
jgi:methyl-accepting chemotaxis protein